MKDSLRPQQHTTQMCGIWRRLSSVRIQDAILFRAVLLPDSEEAKRKR
jgi:hypothetical protein